ncbi:hypothetical protein [Peribacillus sp. NPDC060253]|uniref:hypothetical protein n=1 Tax=Peribacillus sp. NPDC060253 TaxID=3347084 RepID=UPI0036503767
MGTERLRANCRLEYIRSKKVKETPKKTLDSLILTEEEKRDQMLKQVVQDLSENADPKIQ